MTNAIVIAQQYLTFIGKIRVCYVAQLKTKTTKQNNSNPAGWIDLLDLNKQKIFFFNSL